MRKKVPVSMIVSHILLAALLTAVFLPGEKAVKAPWPLLCGVALIEGYYLVKIIRRPRSRTSASDLLAIVWAFLLIWETAVTKLDLMHPVLVPAPENVFAVFAEQWPVLLSGVCSSMELLFFGVLTGLALGTVSGLVCGWISRLREVFYPIANVLAPIPSVVFAPYIIALMPSFRSASAMVIVLGIFWPAFLNTILRVEGMERRIIESARVLKLGNVSMIFEILLPYAMPGVVGGLKVTMTTAVMLLTFAEMMGATSGMGYYIVNYNTYGNYTNVVAGIIVVGLVVTALNRLTSWIREKTIRWRTE
ncbi:ABC transporter permease [Bacilliculturomica massiliensis]|uniref:ABC transporter permease n=1 Tax=Bacilliculturomica massiliensis TaxID=1917867 RepID=UPI001031A116|nr:ABC transporter permease subunit [Bacilliculturomica massiliensis]